MFKSGNGGSQDGITFLASDRAVVTGPTGILTTSTTTAQQIAWLDTITSNVQDQLDQNANDIATVAQDLADHIADSTDAHEASAIGNVPAGNITSTDVQNALNELDGFVDTVSNALAAHISDATDAHDASAISNVPAGNISATDVQGAINELDSEKTFNPMTAVGDLIRGGVLGVPTALPIGSTGYVLKVVGGIPTWVVAGGPSFSAGSSAATTLVSGTATKVTFGTEDWDTDSNFTTSRFTPTTAGYYQINSTVTWTPAANSSNWVSIYKNGTEYQRGSRALEAANTLGLQISSIVFFNGTTDYVEIFGFTNGGNANTSGAAVDSWFNGAFIRGA